ncbi:hypothetical protein SERLA73DRAFT_180001 [Serpula lacrymans var. lacrymans S7.3]|uniref:Uncharacterized protein n=2 Tax=Serpula lacrymans var. lacrymans TaxID=341189 RepID=F8PV95_SERL3|nr:uncharacterized protein SERLADRAFT_465400 [Serpula lacrymans var. lacrymans S7.9]EGN99787.1 hypothetical protein SERLA73DRAFT_180001 [Serpula lacrymans var. lacrymans S7.3]EGO25361.1 hypothetical protein SERLADRAFT_465400 [Serpula lacrymans var. lacrymans S7.9]
MSSNQQQDYLHGFYGWTDTLKGVYYGPGSLRKALPELLKVLGGHKVLIVTGKTLHEKTDIVRRVEAILIEQGAYGATFFEIGQHTPIAGIRRGIQAFKEAGADLIVSVGGGSPVDASKNIIYSLQKESNGPFLRQIAIPTTLSAAEYTIGGGYTDERGQKVSVNAPELAPAGIILDAELTLSTPERLWLSTGIRALDHAVENLYRPVVPLPVKYLCYSAIADLFEYLPKSKANPQDLNVRQRLQVASWMSLWPMKLEKYSALGLSHALGHKLGATYSIPHGITSCLTLASVVALKAKYANQEGKKCLADALFYLREPTTGSVEGDAHKLATKIDDLVLRLGLQTNLQENKVPKEDLPKIAKGAIGEQENEPPIEEVERLLEGIYTAKSLQL